MELFDLCEKQGINFCEICKDVIKKNLDIKMKEEYNPKNKKYIQLNIPSNEELSKLNFNFNKNSNIYCSLCLNILDIFNNKYASLIKEIKSLINDYEHNCVKLVLKFSSIFNLIFWFINTKITKILNKNLNHIFECDTIRQIFINKYTQFFADKLEQKFDNNEYNRDLDLIINYDLNDIIYQKFNEVIYNSIKNKNNENINININNILNKTTGRAVIKSITSELCDIDILYNNLFSNFSLENIISNISLNFILSPTPLYISGNYIKLSREIGQNHFERNYNLSSIDEEMKKFLSKIFINSEKNDYVLSASGREDRNVRMLGTGRNFIYEIFNARKKFGINFEKINEQFNKENKLVKIKNLKLSNKSAYNKIKKEENAKTKKYLAVIYCNKAIEKNVINNLIKENDNLIINQITPIRVLHQRSLKQRIKQIISIKEIEKINEHFFIIEITASAGTYIKEFINGDFGRTWPNLSSLLNCECDILQLDVQDIFY